ncbi:MAG TPA: hypothetical protein ENK54_03450 [Thiotrichales bacterium]|nr:hypothetical protein [Thiotrichales bacterium]
MKEEPRTSTLLWTVFSATCGLGFAQLLVFGLLSQVPTATHGTMLGFGIAFCAAGRILASMILLRNAHRLTGHHLLLMALAVPALFATAQDQGAAITSSPLYALLVAAGFCGLYTVLTYRLNTMVFVNRGRPARERLGRQMQIPYLIAQVLAPIGAGIFHDRWGATLTGLAAGGLFLLTALFAANHEGPGPSPAAARRAPLPPRTRTLLVIAGTSTFLINWYFSAIASALETTPATSHIGFSISAIGIAALVGAILANRFHPRRPQLIRDLFLASSVAPLLLMPTAALVGLADPLSIVALLVSMGFPAGISTSLVGASKYRYVERTDYPRFHQYLAMTVVVATLSGSLSGAWVTIGNSFIEAMTLGLLLSLLSIIWILFGRSHLLTEDPLPTSD